MATLHENPPTGPAGADSRCRRSGLLAASSLRIGALVLAAGLLVGATGRVAAEGQPTGIDVSRWQGDIDWDLVATSSLRFAYVKASEGSTTTNPNFDDQYDGAHDAGLLRGAYHFALPDQSSGTAQADFFVDHGGGWTADGTTLPGALDLEYNPYGATCYDLAPAEMVAWIHDFADEYRARTGRDVVIYTTADWWNSCTDGSTEFAAKHPLWVAQYFVGEPSLPAGWSYYTFWQFTNGGQVPGIVGVVDGDLFKGDDAQLRELASGTLVLPTQ